MGIPLTLHSLFQTTLFLQPHTSPLCIACLHSKCLTWNLSRVPCERTNDPLEWHKDYIKLKISELHAQKEIFSELLLTKAEIYKSRLPQVPPSHLPPHHSREVSSGGGGREQGEGQLTLGSGTFQT